MSNTIIIKYKNTTFSINSFIFDLHHPLIDEKKLKLMHKKTKDPRYKRFLYNELKAKQTKADIRNYFKTHNINSDFRRVAEKYIANQFQARKIYLDKQMIDREERATEEIKELRAKIQELESTE